MKLGEVLSRRADLERKIKALKEQIGQNLFKQEDQAAVLDPAALIREAEQAASELADLIRRINRTNAQTEVEAGQTLSDLLTERDCEKAKRAIYLAGPRSRADAVSWSQIRASDAPGARCCRLSGQGGQGRQALPRHRCRHSGAELDDRSFMIFRME